MTYGCGNAHLKEENPAERQGMEEVMGTLTVSFTTELKKQTLQNANESDSVLEKRAKRSEHFFIRGKQIFKDIFS